MNINVRENQYIEFKSTFVDEVKKEIIAFANSQGGKIYIGIADDGTILGVPNNELNDIELKIFNWLRDGIERNFTNYVQTKIEKIEDKSVFIILIEEGNQKPYFLTDKGPKPSGVYIRIGNSTRQATFEEILQMQLECANIEFELTKCNNQDLTFSYISDKFKSEEIEFNKSKYKTLNFLNQNGEYTYTAFLFSDQNNVEIKCGVYKGIERTEFLSKKEFSGCILKQVDNIIDYLNILNDVTVKFDGSPQRIEIPNYPKQALREVVLNSVIHRDYMPHSNVKLEFFDDRFEITSPGNLVKGLTLDDIMTGTSKLRNPSIAKIFEMLDYIEAYGTGFKRVFDSYEKFNLKPEIVLIPNFFRVIMPNIKYKENKNGGLNGGLNDGLNELQIQILEIIKANEHITQKSLSNLLNVSIRTTERNISELKRIGKIVKDGSKKTGKWRVL